ncbi:MAG: prepilin-type N-terminal cleavage/methylation domain-containing protein [Candidatus Omnitrophica bacterium]|nr:prepilin-type N-terminal cleavage/methylation domain-containing protein [Candidatus Omnitrophota bacterium]
MDKRGFSLMEVIVATALFSIVIVGMLSVFVAGNKQVIHSRERMVSSQLGKLFVDPMQAHVRQDTWDAWNGVRNALYVPPDPLTSFTTYCDSDAGHATLQNPACPSLATERKINNREFSVQHDVSRVCIGDCFTTGIDTGMRRVTTTISWNEPS